MASANGNRVGHWWANVNAWVASETETHATVTVECRFQSDPWGYDVWSGNSTAVSCDGQSSGTVGYGTISVGYGVAANVLTLSRSFTVAKSSGGRNVWCTAAFTLGGYEPGTSTAGVNVWVNGISYRQPHPPTDPAVSRVSDAEARLTWQANYTGMDGLYPWTGIYVDRATDEGGWVAVKTLNWDALNWTDNSIAPNHCYRYAVRSYGPGGTSQRVECAGSPVYTTPAAPVAVTLSKSTDTVVAVDITGPAPYAEGYDVEYSLNGGEWESGGSTSTFPYDVQPGGGTVRFRVRAVRGELASAWTESGEIATITPPLAPSVTAAGGAAVVPTGTAIEVAWTPNHPDGSVQSSAQVEVTIGDGAAQTYDVSGSATSYTVPAQASATTVRVRVRTHGLDPDWGAWSAAQAVTVAVSPTVAVTAPAIDGDSVELLPYALEWQATAPDGIASQTMTLSTGGRTVLSVNLAGDADGYELSPATYMPDNGATYTLTVTVRAGSTLSEQASRTFAVDYAGPAEPTAAVSYGADLSASLLVIEGTDPDREDTESIDVVRVLPDGSQWTVATGLTSGQTAVDPLPPLNTDFTYSLVARSATGTVTTASVPARVDAMAAALNFGAAAEECAVLELDPSRSRSVEIATEMYDFADGGESDGLPVAYSTASLSATGSEAATVLTVEEYRELERLARRYPMCWARDVHGGRAYCHASWSFSAGVPWTRIDCSVSLTETRWREAW